ncbi:MAG: DUF4256 domain-containing protein [Parvularculaceae bacterium]|nr:DUF4256 domain-containing protein [Parvularculaceae bacterium]
MLKARFAANMNRRPGLKWEDAQVRLSLRAERLGGLRWMEETGGEPVVTGREGDAFAFTDCSAESPVGRRSLCYDREALDGRKENKPKDSAMAVAARMGVELLAEDRYRALREVGEFDLATSNRLATPAEIRARGGAIFGDRRFGRVFIYRNGAASYYAARGFRAQLLA